MKYYIKNIPQDKYFAKEGYLTADIEEAEKYTSSDIHYEYLKLSPDLKLIPIEKELSGTCSNDTAHILPELPKCKILFTDFGSDEEEKPEFHGGFGGILSSINSLLEYKNEKYGNSALEPLEIFQGKCKVGQRLDDKLSRVKNSEELKKNDVADLIGYLVLTCKEKGWTNFDEFMD